MNCPYCGNPMPSNHTVTCGDSYCSEAGYHERMAYAGKKKERNFHHQEYKRVISNILDRKDRLKELQIAD